MAGRPTGAVTFLFTDVEGSTQAWEEDPTGMASALEIHDHVVRTAIEAHNGFVFATSGDSFSAAFSSPSGALTAAMEAQRRLVESQCGLRVRMGVHSGEAFERDGNYFGPPLNRTARLMSIGHGGQVIVSDVTRGLVTAAEFEFIDLGEHRLADLSAPTRISQLVAEGLETEFAPLRSIVAVDNLPLLGEVFGRSTDIARLSELFVARRLVTLTGAGGIGKTTLATAVAAEMSEHFSDGRWLVDLTDLPAGADSTAVSTAVAGVDERFGSIEALAPRRLLMILDNCEHVLDGVRYYLGELLGAAPKLKVLATSREPLDIRGEMVHSVAPLSIDEDSDHASAVDLFIERANEAGVTLDLDSDSHAIAAICREVGGLPLAIELAAARTAVMTPDQILDRLSDRLSLLRGGRGGPDHHRTIESTIAWSYDLLEGEIQRLLRFLSVFEGGFDLDQAEAVGRDETIDQLADLVRKSLVQREGNRFGMLEAVRQYATARLRDSEEEDRARQKHFDFFADWADEVYQREETITLTAPERTWCTANLTNLHQSIIRGIELGETTRAGRIAVVLWHHYIASLYGRPTNDWFQPLLAHLDEFDPQLQMGVLHGSGAINHWHLGDLEAGERLARAGYELHKKTGMLTRTGANPHTPLAMIALTRGEPEVGIGWYQKGLEELGNDAKPHLAGNLARAFWDYHGDAAHALEVLEDARLHLELVTAPWQTFAHATLEAEMLFHLGDLKVARRQLEGLLPKLRQPGLRSDLYTGALTHLAKIERVEGNLGVAALHYLEVIEIEEADDYQPRLWHTWEAIHVASLLLDLDNPQLAARITAAFRSQSEIIPPTHERELKGVEAQIQTTASDLSHAELRVDEPLAEALRSALTL